MSTKVKRFGEEATKFILAVGGTLLLAKCVIGFIAAVAII